jgi:hypothetical protein
MSVLVYGMLCTVAYYLFARAEISRWFWSAPARAWAEVEWLPPEQKRAHHRSVAFLLWFWSTLDALLSCAACSGFWLGLGCSFLMPVPGAGLLYGPAWTAHGLGAAWGLLLTPPGTWLLRSSMTGAAVAEEGRDGE